MINIVSRLTLLIGLVLFISWSNQETPEEIILTDDNFKKIISKGFFIIEFTSEWQETTLDSVVFEGIEGYNDCGIIIVMSKNVKSIVKKLRIRNYPSVALFHNGTKKEIWKADMGGHIEITNKAIKKAIDNVLAGDIF